MRTRRGGHVAPIGRRRMHIEFWWENQKRKYYYEDLDVGGRIILK
jgi:hypothetical protein